jgi:hypothetical protein
MSSALYIILDREIPGLDTFMNGKALAAAEAAVAVHCERRGVRDLWSFYSIAPGDLMEALEGFDGLEGVIAGDAAPEVWFAARDGLATIRALQDALQQEMRGASGETVLHDLRDMERILIEADRAGARWHLAVDH